MTRAQMKRAAMALGYLAAHPYNPDNDERVAKLFNVPVHEIGERSPRFWWIVKEYGCLNWRDYYDLEASMLLSEAYR